jgi:hypothetical protein
MKKGWVDKGLYTENERLDWKILKKIVMDYFHSIIKFFHN